MEKHSVGLFICLFVLENFIEKKKYIYIYCAKLLIEHDYIATVVCMSLVCLTFWTLSVIRNLNILTRLLD
jgi:hypothetical protein